METIRSFIALELAPEIHQELARVETELKKSGADVKWVEPHGIHLTLKFLGSVSLELLKEIKKVIDRLAGAHQGFALTISGLGAFPKIEYPRVVWVDIEEGKNESQKLTQDLEERLVHLGFMKEKRPFKAHLTLGRVRSEHNRNQLKQLLQSVTVSPKTMQIEKVVLFQSTLTPQGAIYVPLHEAKLG